MSDAKEVFAQLDRLYRQGADPAGKDGQELAARWWNMVNEFTDGDTNLLKTLLSAGRDISNWPKEAKNTQEAIEHFLKKAFDIYFTNNGIHLPELEERAND
jgi:MerR family transcriptional regulator, thiopeptide resistance regulator